LTFYGNAALSFDVHVVQDLVPELPVFNEMRMLDKPVGERRLSMVDMGYNTEISYLFHCAY
jgi:hypothetical protein